MKIKSSKWCNSYVSPSKEINLITNHPRFPPISACDKDIRRVLAAFPVAIRNPFGFVPGLKKYPHTFRRVRGPKPTTKGGAQKKTHLFPKLKKSRWMDKMPFMSLRHLHILPTALTVGPSTSAFLRSVVSRPVTMGLFWVDTWPGKLNMDINDCGMGKF